MKMNRAGLHFLCFLGCLFLGLGLFGPSFSVNPQFGEYTNIIKALDPDFDKVKVYSIFSGIRALFGSGEILVGLVLALFSVCFPLWKFGAMWEAVLLGQGEGRKLALAEKLGKYSMLDIFVLAVLVVAIKGLPGGTKAALHWGTACFCISILISFVIPRFIRGIK